MVYQFDTYPAGGPCTGLSDRHPKIPVGVSLLNYIVRNGTASVIQRRIPGDHHVVSVDFIKNDRSLWWLRTIWKEDGGNVLITTIVF